MNAQNHPDARPRLASGRPRVMMDAHLADPIPQSLGSGKNLRVDQRSHRLHFDLVEESSRKQLERAVDVAQPETEHHVYQRRPAERVDLADR